MKRYVSIDFLRGISIFLMLMLHIFIETYDVSIFVAAVQQGEGQIGLIIIAVVLVFFASFAGFFISISGFSNTISMHKQHKKLVAAGVPKAYRVVRKNQVIKGLVLYILAYFNTVIMEPLVLEPLGKTALGLPIEITLYNMIGNFFWIHVIAFLGVGTIIVSLFYTAMLKRNWSFKQIKLMLVLTIVFLYLASPFILYGIRSIPEFWGSSDGGPWRNRDERSALLNLGFFFLNILAGREQALFPWIIAFFMGTLIAADVLDKPISRKFRWKWIIVGLAMFILGLVLQLVFAGIAGGLEGEEKLRFEAGFGIIFGAQYRSSAYMMFVGGIETIIITSFLRSVEGKNRGAKFAKHTVFFRRFGMVALTIYFLQMLGLLPVFWLENRMGLVMWGHQETSLQSLLIITIVMEVWIAVVMLWEKIKFIGTFEWLAGKILGIFKKGAGKKMNLLEVLYNVEPVDGSKFEE